MKKLIQRTMGVAILSFAAQSANGAPEAPELYDPVGMLDNNIPFMLTWEDVDNATWYRVSITDEAEGDGGFPEAPIRMWLKASDHCESDICSWDAAGKRDIVGTAVWQVRGYDGTDLGAWSLRAKFWVELPPPQATTLNSPLLSTTDSTPEFSWINEPGATWFKLDVRGANDEVLVSQWFRATSDNIDCEASDCFKTPMVMFDSDFSWRVRTYNAAGLGPWTDYESVTLVLEEGTPLQAAPNPLELEQGSFQEIQIMVSNTSDETVTNIDIGEVSAQGPLLTDSDGTSDIECEEIVTQLAPTEECIITKMADVDDYGVGELFTLPVTGFFENSDEEIVPLIIEVEIISQPLL